METVQPVLPVFLFVVCAGGLAVVLVVLGYVFNPRRPTPVKHMPYESGMDPIHDTRRRFDIGFQLLAIAFLVFDVELLFLYPWAVTAAPARAAASVQFVVPPSGGFAENRLKPELPTATSDRPAPTATQQATSRLLAGSPAGRALVEHRRLVFAGVMVFVALLGLGFVYDWRKGIFEWR